MKNQIEHHAENLVLYQKLTLQVIQIDGSASLAAISTHLLVATHLLSLMELIDMI